jgi:hypothetical protein
MAIIDPETGEVQYATPTVIKPPTASTVYSADNINQAVTQPVTAPNLQDPYGLYDQFMNSADIQAAKARVAEGQGLINKSNQALRTTTTALENQNENAMGGTGASVNLIGRQVGRARTLTANELAALGENQNANISYLSSLKDDAVNRYAIAQNERAQIQDLIRQTGGKAKISYTDSYETALQKADKYITEKAKEEAKDAYKKELKAQLLALGKNTKGLSTKELEKKLKKYNKEALKEAKSRSDQEWNMKVAQFNKSMSSGGGGGGSTKIKTTFTEVEQRQMINEALAGGEDWNAIFETFDALGIDTGTDSVMDKYLKQKFNY